MFWGRDCSPPQPLSPLWLRHCHNYVFVKHFFFFNNLHLNQYTILITKVGCFQYFLDIDSYNYVSCFLFLTIRVYLLILYTKYNLLHQYFKNKIHSVKLRSFSNKVLSKTKYPTVLDSVQV